MGLFSCAGQVDEPVADSIDDPKEEFISPETPDYSFYIDDELIADVQLEFGMADSGYAKPVLATINKKKYEILKYEGTLIEAAGISEGYRLRFQPYNEIDPATEEVIKSKYDFYLDLNISRKQNEYLGYVKASDETNNLEWDYLENLFEIFYYTSEGKNYPLKLIDHGKTEWDG